MELKKDIVFASLRRDIQVGNYAPGQKLPNELDFSQQLGVAKKTLRHALERLESEGLISRHRALGTFVRDGKAMEPNRKYMVVFDDKAGAEIPSHYIIPGVQHAATQAGVELRCMSTDYVLAMEEADIKENLRRQGIAGILLFTEYFHGHERILKLLRAAGLPVVLPHTARPRDSQVTGFAALVFDERAACELALAHLAERGHRRVGSVHARGETGRFRGFTPAEYLDFLAGSGLDSNPRLLKLVDYDPAQIEGAVNALMRLPQPPTALLCYSDFYALQVYRALKALSLRVPEDVAVMGYCGYPGGSLLEPPLSTVDLGYFKIGQLAFEVLENAKSWFGAKNTAPPLLHTPFNLAARGSTDIQRVEKLFEEVENV